MSEAAISPVGAGMIPSENPDRLSSGPTALFTYGTLLFPEVLRTLIGRVPERRMATALGWRVSALVDRAYPGLIATPDSRASGRLVTGLSHDEWRLIDSFEDDKYELRNVALADGRDGWAYVWTDHEEACPIAWDVEDFALTYLSAYVEHCAAWRAGYG